MVAASYYSNRPLMSMVTRNRQRRFRPLLSMEFFANPFRYGLKRPTGGGSFRRRTRRSFGLTAAQEDLD